MNYITKQLLIEIDENEINKVKIGNLTKDVKRDAITNLSIGLSVLIGVLTMPLIDYLNFSMIYTLKIILVLVAYIPLFAIKWKVNKNKGRKLQLYSKKGNCRAFVLPKNNVVIKNILLNLIVTFLVIVLTLGFVIEEQSNYIYIFGMMAILACILFQNVLLYAQTKIPGKHRYNKKVISNIVFLFLIIKVNFTRDAINKINIDSTHFGVKNNIIYIGLPIIIFMFSLMNLIT